MKRSNALIKTFDNCFLMLQILKLEMMTNMLWYDAIILND